eukprot:6186955-Prymnesium_polylepis.1
MQLGRHVRRRAPSDLVRPEPPVQPGHPEPKQPPPTRPDHPAYSSSLLSRTGAHRGRRRQSAALHRR